MMSRSYGPKRSKASAACIVALVATLILTPMAAAQKAISRPGTGVAPSLQELRTQAEQASRKGETPAAIRLYLESLQIQPKWPDGWRNVGILLAQVKDYPRAIIAFGNFIQLQPKDGSGWVLRGLCEFELRRFAQALDDLQEGAHLGLHNAALEKVATYHAALIYIQKGNFYVATRLLTHLAREGVDSSNIIAAFGLATLRIAWLPGEWASAEQKALVLAAGQIALDAVSAPPAKIISDYEALIQRFPRARGLHYALGNYLMYQAQYGSALAQMKAELQLDPTDTMALLQAAMSELQLGHPHQALPYAEKASEIASKLFVVHYTLGLTFYHLNEIPQALKELKAAVRLAPNSPQAHYALSHAYLKAGDQPAALREGALFAKLKQEPTPATTFRFRNRKPAPSTPTTATALDSQALKATFTQAEQDLREARYAQAEAGFHQALKLQPNYPPAYCDLGVVCLRTNRINQAILYFQTAQKLAPKLAGINLDLGLAYYQKRDFPKALPEFSAVLQSDPHNLQARYLNDSLSSTFFMIISREEFRLRAIIIRVSVEGKAIRAGRCGWTVVARDGVYST